MRPNLAIVPSTPPTGPAPIDFERINADQVHDVVAWMHRDTSGDVAWPWRSLNSLIGPMVPGEMHFVGALTGNGKSSVLMSLMDQLLQQGIGVLYLPLELPPRACRMRWAAWRLGLPYGPAYRGQWELLQPDTRERLIRQAEADALLPVSFCPERRLTPGAIERWATAAMSQFGAKVLIVDHLHRLDAGDVRFLRQNLADSVRMLSDMTQALKIVTCAALQLNRTGDPLDDFVPPTLDRIRETSAIADEATTVTMLSRQLSSDADPGMIANARRDKIVPPALMEPHAIRLTCRKDRVGDARGRGVTLRIDDGRVTEPASYYRGAPVPEPDGGA